MTETFNFDFFQIPAVGVQEPDLAGARSSVTTTIRRPVDMKISNFGALEVGARLSTDYTRTATSAFKAAGESSDWSRITEDLGIGQNVKLFGVNVNHNPYVLGSTVKFARDDQFVRMTMTRNTGSALAAMSIDAPKFDVMDTDMVTAEGMIATTNYTAKTWPSEGWRSFGGKYDFVA